MPAQSSERIQVGFSEVVLQAIKDLAGEEGLKKARVCSILIEEALIARGRLSENKVSERMPSSLAAGFFPPLTEQETTQVIKQTGQEPFTVAPKTNTLSQELKERTPEPEPVPAPTTDAELEYKITKLKLMEKLMNELQSM